MDATGSLINQMESDLANTSQDENLETEQSIIFIVQ